MVYVEYRRWKGIRSERKYYSDEVKYKPNDKVYYFVEYMSMSESYKECGSLNMCGCHLIRDIKNHQEKKLE